MTKILLTLDPAEWVALGFVLGFMVSQLLRFRSETSVKTHSVPTTFRPVTSVTDVPPGASDPVIINIRDFFDRQVRRAYASTNAVCYDSFEFILEEELRHCLIDAGLIDLTAEQEQVWFHRITVPHYIKASVDKFELLTQLVEQRFYELLAYI